MYRHPRPFVATSPFQPAHRILSPSAGDTSRQDSTPFHNPSHSYTRHRPPPRSDDEIDSGVEYVGPPHPIATEMSRASWEHGGPASVAVPLLPLGNSPSQSAGGNWKSGSSGFHRQSHTLLSRTPSPYSGIDEHAIGAGVAGRCAGGKERGAGFFSWFERGKLGWWLWNTQPGWISLVTVMTAWNIGFGILLVFLNQVIMRFGVYKFGYPITTTLFELLVTEFCLIITASLTRSFPRIICSLGLSHLIAPPPTPSPNSKPSFWCSPLLEDFLPTGTFGFSLRLATIVFPLAVIHSSKLILTNLSFAWTLRPIWNLSRSATIPITLLSTYLFANQNPPLSVTTLSSTLTITFGVVIVSIQPPWLFTWEGIVSGICSSFCAAAEPVLLITTFRRILAYHSPYQNPSESSTMPTSFHGDGQSLARSHYHLIHYSTILSALLVLPWVFLSGEAGDISRNCYILDIPWFWIIIFLGGLVSYAGFLGFWMLVKTTSPLTGNLVAEGVQVILQTMLLGGFKMQEWGWMGAITGLGAGVWYLLGRRRECGVSLWSGVEPGEDMLWDEDRMEEGGEEEFLVN